MQEKINIRFTSWSDEGTPLLRKIIHKHVHNFLSRRGTEPVPKPRGKKTRGKAKKQPEPHYFIVATVTTVRAPKPCRRARCAIRRNGFPWTTVHFGVPFEQDENVPEQNAQEQNAQEKNAQK